LKDNITKSKEENRKGGIIEIPSK